MGTIWIHDGLEDELEQLKQDGESWTSLIRRLKDSPEDSSGLDIEDIEMVIDARISELENQLRR